MNLSNELQQLLNEWAREAASTVAVMEALPRGQYDFRPDSKGRSLGELAWHLAEIDGYLTMWISQGEFRTDVKPANIQRPKTVEALAPAYRVVHEEAVARVWQLGDADLDRRIKYADGELWTIRDLLRRQLLMHATHHRGQLTLLCRLAGGVPPGVYGSNREETLAKRAVAAPR